jgi:hypothetical protein
LDVLGRLGLAFGWIALAAVAPAPKELTALGDVIDAAAYRDDAGRVYVRLPRGYHWVPVRENTGIAYSYAFRHDRDPLEVRFYFDRMTNSRMFHGPPAKGEFRADLDSASPSIAQTLRFNMGGGDGDPLFPFPRRGVSSEFAADWGFTGMFELDPKHPFAAGYKVGQLHFLHRKDVGNCVVMVLAADPQTLERSEADPLMYTVRFIDPKDRPDPAARLSCPAGSRARGKPFPVGRLQVCMREGTEVAEGPFVSVHPNGKLERRGAYRDGKPEGLVETFDYLGRLQNRRSFRAGKPHGPDVDFYPGGQKAAESVWADGSRVGAVAFFDEKGRPADEAAVSAAMERLAREEQLRDLAQAVGEQPK